MSSKSIQGFTILPTSILKDSTSPHELFIKEHSLRHQEENKPPGRTLFVLNIPPFVTEDVLKCLFSSYGKVLNVIFQSNSCAESNGFKTAYVIFFKREGVVKALQLTRLCLDQLQFKSGLDYWIDNFNNSIIDPSRFIKEINEFMLNFDKAEAKKSKKSLEVDGGGWTVVTNKGRSPGIARKESVKLKLDEKITETKKKKELKNFYTFQLKESKQKNLAMLRKNYEEAKKKVALMRNTRRFKPY